MQDPKTIVLCSAISEVFLRKLAKQKYIRYVEGSEFIDTREDLIEMGDPDGGGLKEMDEKLKKYALKPGGRNDQLTDVAESKISKTWSCTGLDLRE